MNKHFTETLKQSKEPVKQKRLPGQRPIGLICPLCGREFGTMSLKIHMKSCRQKFENSQAHLPPNQRKNVDKLIENYEKNEKYMRAGVSGKGGYNLDALNQQAFDQYNKDALVE